MEIFVSAGEASSDIHCAHLVRTLKRKAREAGMAEIKTFGLGGDALQLEGMELLMHNREFSVGGGPVEVVSKIPLRYRLERILENQLFSKRVPAGAILVDNGEINLRLASLLHFFDVPIVYFIPPKVWVWRHARIEQIQQHVDLVLGILPFEEPIYREWEIPFQYVGNPLIDEIDTALSPVLAKERLGIDPSREAVAVFLGSRHNEVAYHGELFGKAIRHFLERLPADEARPTIVLPAAQAIELAEIEAGFGSMIAGTGATIKVVKGMSHECLRASRVALVKSGTSTLEAAMLGIPMVLAYHSSKSSEWFFRHIVRYRGFVGLVNLFLADDIDAAMGWSEKRPTPAVPELILEHCTAENISSELLRIYRDGAERAGMMQNLQRTRELLLPPDKGEVSPIEMAAKSAWNLFTAAGSGHA